MRSSGRPSMATISAPETSLLFRNLNFDLGEPPPYLFRTFDPKTSDYTDEKITMPPAAVRKLPHHDKDIFSLEPDFAMAVLEKHQNPWRRKNKPPELEPNIDNFISGQRLCSTLCNMRIIAADSMAVAKTRSRSSLSIPLCFRPGPPYAPAQS